MAHPHVYLARSKGEQQRFANRHRQGLYRRIVPRVYVDAGSAAPDQVVREALLEILAFVHPGSVLAWRSAHDLVANEDRIWLIDERGPLSSRRKQLGPITVWLLGGDVETGVEPVVDGLGRMTDARVLLESLNSRARRGREKFLTRGECERVLIRVMRRGETALNELRDEARAIAGPLGCQHGFEQLSAMVSALLNSGEARGSLTPSLVKVQGEDNVGRKPLDINCIERCIALKNYLNAQTFPHRPLEYKPEAWRYLAFFESYFSNYIEGTEMTVREAEKIVFESSDIPDRSADSHDVRGCFQICSDHGEMVATPRSPEELISLLKERHRILMGGRPEHFPGELKTQPNQAGNTVFVAPELVEGTLYRGYELYADLAPGLIRALFMHFLITDVHPVTDGNGRLARLMTNAELVSVDQAKIIVPTVARDDYLTGQRQATRERNFRVMCKVLVELQGYTASLPALLYDDLYHRLEADRAFALPDGGLATFNKVKRPYRFEPVVPD